MRRLGLVTLLALLALPSAALGRTFSARVVRATDHSLTVRVAGGRIVRLSAPRTATASPRQPLLAHAARERGAQMTFSLAALEPGVVVLISKLHGAVTIALPGPGQAEKHATGVVTGVAPGSYLIRLGDRTELRVHGGGVRRCETASVAYHQDVSLLVADRVQVAHRAARCADVAASGYLHHVARGTVTASGNGALTIIDSATGRRETFATNAVVSAGDHVVIVYHRGAGASVVDALYAA